MLARFVTDRVVPVFDSGSWLAAGGAARCARGGTGSDRWGGLLWCGRLGTQHRGVIGQHGDAGHAGGRLAAQPGTVAGTMGDVAQ